MARNQHLSRLAAPRAWPIKRKGIKWVAKPIPGVHNLETSIPLVIALRDLLGFAKISKNIKQALNTRTIFVNNRIETDIRFPIGIFDVLSIPKVKKYYRLIFNAKGKFNFVNISDKDAEILPLKLVNKTVQKKGKVQLNFSNGWNFLADKIECSTNDTILFDLKERKIKNILNLKKGVSVYIIGGKHIGKIGIFDKIKSTGLLKKNKIASIIIDKAKVETSLAYVFVIGEKSPEIKL